MKGTVVKNGKFLEIKGENGKIYQLKPFHLPEGKTIRWLNAGDRVTFRTKDKDRIAEKSVDKIKTYKLPVTPRTHEEIFGDKSAQRPKTKAKAIGLKSLLYYDDKIIATSFGKGNKANVEKIVSDKIENIYDPANYSIFINDKLKSFVLQDKKGENSVSINLFNATISNEADHKGEITINAGQIGRDQIGLKDALEEKIFGKTYNDNIHVQIAYNILDVEKILTEYINDIVYAMNNAADISPDRDLVGYLGHLFNYQKYWSKPKSAKNKPNFDKFVNSPRLINYGEAFYTVGRDGPQRKSEREIFYMLSFVGYARQFIAHEYEKHISIYDPAKAADKEVADFLDKLFADKIDEVNSDFLKLNAKNIAIICDIFPNENRNTLIKEFYQFSVLKAHKNMGFSIKTLRETLLALEQAQQLRSYIMQHQDFRRQVNTQLDFMIYKRYKDSSRAKSFADALRATAQKEDKPALYIAEASKLYAETAKFITTGIFAALDSKQAQKLENFPALPPEAIKDVCIGSQAYDFVKLIYLFTLLLDGKEINNLLTGLISKFDNINSLCRIYTEITGLVNLEDRHVKFEKDYSIFKDCGRVVAQLQMLNGFARMQKRPDSQNNAKAKKAKDPFAKTDFGDAVMVLGVSPQDKKAAIDKLTPGMKNYISNNVLNSSRFRYLVRYADVKNVSILAKSKVLTEFVLADIPDNQIERYTESCGGNSSLSVKEKRQFLAQKIAELSIDNMYVEMDKKATEQQKLQRENNKNILGLYLTVLYLVCKNLVNVNARYLMAFHCLARDSYLLGKPYNKDSVYDYTVLTADYIRHSKNAHMAQCLATDAEKSNNRLIHQFRNSAAHLGAVRKAHLYIGDIKQIDSYYALYHYIMQRQVLAQADSSDEECSK
ncbi:MAG: type VI-D CRISPR-associated RNA-guided ribonuclease Cas13d, partial [Oscillospiraceae bacterium]|nr:type VI-D CRISPR-associated RNA-guided ribonuclease Cas13d [Oscillospiraceae bacterium]